MNVNTEGLSLRPADDEALDAVERLLRENELPAADVRAKSDCFYVAILDEERVGVGGIESVPPDGLLRSVVVEESKRGLGLGGVLCDRLEARARADGVETVYLLTTTAADFFAARGYEEIDRVEAPTAVRETSQFQGLCPSTAVCMRKRL